MKRLLMSATITCLLATQISGASAATSIRSSETINKNASPLLIADIFDDFSNFLEGANKVLKSGKKVWDTLNQFGNGSPSQPNSNSGQQPGTMSGGNGSPNQPNSNSEQQPGGMSGDNGSPNQPNSNSEQQPGGMSGDNGSSNQPQ